MYERFPELLSQPLKIDAKSSTVRRCMLSMFNFCQELQAQNPQLEITMDASKHDFRWVVEDLTIKPAETPASEAYEQQRSAIFEGAHNPTRLMASLFTDVRKAEEFISGRDLMEALYNVAEDLQNVPELNIEVIAEGVETREQVDFLSEVGCGVMQGFYYDKPLPKEEFNERLTDSGYYLRSE